LIALAISGAIVLNHAGALAAAGLALLAGWSALSAIWAESVGRTWTATNRLALYAVVLLLALAVIRTVAAARVALGVFGAGVVAVGLYVVGRMLEGSGPELFVAFRLHDPLGYINGQAALFLMALWVSLAYAERARAHWQRGAALGAGVLLGNLTVLTQSRAAIPVFAISAALLLFALPGRVRRGWMLVFVALGVAAALPFVLDVYGERTHSEAELPSVDLVRRAGVAAILSALGAGLAWGAASWTRARSLTGLRARLPARALLALTALVVVALVVRVGSPVDEVTSGWDDFSSLNPGEETAARFTSADGYRYDLWRIALNQFEDHPLRGVGSGNYVSTYHRERRTNEDVQQPHSLELQTLAELGIVGALCLAMFVGAAYAGAARWRRVARAAAGRADVFIAALGVFTVWLVYTSVDWLHVIPGVTAAALVAAAVLTARLDGGASASGRLRQLVPVLTVVAAVAIAASLARHYGATIYRERGQDKLATDASAALADARRSLALNEHDIDTYVLMAAAQARQGKYEDARATLVAATSKEPYNHLPWALLGDLAARRGDSAQAARDYDRARELNPRLELKESRPAG
jgi:O-antigen ligase